MTDRNLKNGFICSVIDRKRNLDAGDINISHDAGSGDVQDTVVGCQFLICQIKTAWFFCQIVVKGLRFRPHAVEFLFVHVCDLSRISCDCPCLMERVPPVTETRICNQGNS